MAAIIASGGRRGEGRAPGAVRRTGDEDAFVEAKRLYERALAEGEDAQLHVRYAWLLMGHSNFSLRQAVAQYERAIELDPSADKAHYQLIAARASCWSRSARSISTRSGSRQRRRRSASTASWPTLTSPGTTTAMRDR
jgi:hypothetical protein